MIISRTSRPFTLSCWNDHKKSAVHIAFMNTSDKEAAKDFLKMHKDGKKVHKLDLAKAKSDLKAPQTMLQFFSATKKKNSSAPATTSQQVTTITTTDDSAITPPPATSTTTSALTSSAMPCTGIFPKKHGDSMWKEDVSC